jgi:prophage antirepressor-like protein
VQSLTEFKFHTHSIRVFPTDDGNSFVAVAADVAGALEYRDASDRLRCVDDEDKGYTVVRTPGGTQRMRTINESGVYTAAIRTHRQQSKPFRRWVTSEVLPAIRRTGGYVHPAAADSAQASLALAQASLALAQEVGFLRDPVASRDRLIVAKDRTIDRLKDCVIGGQRHEIKLLKEVRGLAKRLSSREAKELVILMESQGHPRVDIAARTGKTLNHIRQIVRNARLAGRLPKNQGELNFK